MSGVVFTANHLTVTDKKTIRKKTEYKSQKYTHKHNTNQRKYKQQKQNFPGLVASYDTQPGNEVGLFYNSPEHPPRSILERLHMNQLIHSQALQGEYTTIPKYAICIGGNIYTNTDPNHLLIRGH